MAERHRAAADCPRFTPGQHAPVDDADDFVGDRRRGIEPGLGFGHEWSPISGEAREGTRARIGERSWKESMRQRQAPAATPPDPSRLLRIRPDQRPAFTFGEVRR